MKFKLSICMMVKDEEKNLRRCLESLNLLINQPYTELIIVDTGSKDKTIDIAGEYTEKLYFHPWNNNFADMRNITISYGKGEWIFIMDADEELKNPQELLDLLNDKRINKFNTIMLREKEAQKIVIPGNTINAELFNTSRLFKNDGEFKYIGAVHNQPLSKNPTFLAQDIILYHYGYDISDKELMEKKFKRTSELLKGEINKDPENVYYIYQLSVSYSMHGDKREAWDEIQKAYALIKDKDNKTKIKCSYVYNKYAVFGYAQGRYEDIINVCKEGIEIRPDYIDLYFFAAQAFEILKKNQEAVKYYKKYLDLMDDFENSTFTTDFSVVLHTAVVESQNYAHEKIARDYMNNDNYTEAIKHAKLIKENNNGLVNLLFNIYIKFEKYNELKNYYLTLEENKRNYLTYILEECKNTLTVQEIENVEYNFSDLEDNYGLLNKIRIGVGRSSDISNEEETILSLDFNKLPDYYGDIIYKLLKIKYPIYYMLINCCELRLNKFFEYLGFKYEDLTETILNYLVGNKTENDFNKVRVNKALKRYIIAFNKLDDKQFFQIFKSYIKDGISYINEVYNKRIIEEERIFDLKNEEEAFLIYMYKAEDIRDNSESEYVKYLGKALKSFPEMKRGIEVLLDEIKNRENCINDEMEKLKVELKKNIKSLIDVGNLKEAKSLISEYKKMVADDVEIYSMEAVILILEGNISNAEVILKKGLAEDNNNFDLLYNLAYLYETKENYLEALKSYNKALVKNYYDIDTIIVKSKIRELKQKIQNRRNNEVILYASKIENVLFINFSENRSLHTLAKILTKYAINVDMAYTGTNPLAQLKEYSNPYRKILGITDLDGLIEYIKYYNYDNIYSINISNNIKDYFKLNNLKVSNKILLGKTDEEIIQYFYNTKMEPYTQYKYNRYNNMSIVIPTYNRTYYLNRVLTFISNYEYIKPKIIVLDSSEKNEKQGNEKIIDKFKNKVDIEYRVFDSDIIPEKKFNYGIQGVTTKYMALCADDDFLTEEGIVESIKFLEQNNLMYSAKGKNLYFINSMGNLSEYDWFVTLNQDKSIDRLKKITEGFVPSLLYQVFITEKFKKLYSFLDLNVLNLPWNTFMEYLIYFIIIATGKIGKINVDLNIRDKGAEKYKRTYNFPDAVKDKTFNEKYNLFKNLLKEYFIYISEPIDNFDEDIKMIFSKFLINFLQIPREFVEIKNDEFDFEKLEQGIKKSWVYLV